MSSYFSKYKRIITDTDTQTVNPTMKFNMTVEQYQDLMHHTHRASDILADDVTSVGASIQEITNSVEDLKTAIDANTEADETNVDAINEALDNLKNTLSEHSTESDERITAASDAIDELKKLISYNSSADETNAAAMEEALAAIKDLIQANTDNDAANLEATTNSIATLTALITENSNADEEQATSVAASLTELNGLIQANANKATEINGAIEVLGVKVQKNADDIADTEKVIVDITEENAVLKSTIAKIKAQLRQIMDNITEPKTTLPAADANGVITLDWDYAAPLTVAEGETVTLDLNGYNLDCDTGCTVINKGNLTIVGEGIVSCGASNSAAIANFPGATCTLEGGTFQSSAWYTIKNCGIMVIDGDVTITTNSDSNVSSLIDNGWYGSTD
jgi:methyl-accepting chemotaxis protein